MFLGDLKTVNKQGKVWAVINTSLAMKNVNNFFSEDLETSKYLINLAIMFRIYSFGISYFNTGWSNTLGIHKGFIVLVYYNF